MAVLVECLVCHQKQAVKNKVCRCGANLDEQKKLKVRVDGKTRGKSRYHIQYRLPGGKQHKQFVGYSLTEAKDANAKRRVQKRENRIFEMVPGTELTFLELAGWYFELEDVKDLRSTNRIKAALNGFNEEFGHWTVLDLKATHVENWQKKMLKKGLAPATVDGYRTTVCSMLTKAEDNDMIDIRALKPFKKAKRVFRVGENARDRILSRDEYERLLVEASDHLSSGP